jgi:hypothetical protein
MFITGTEHFNWLNTKLSVALYTYPQISLGLLFRWIIFPLSSKGAGSDP